MGHLLCAQNVSNAKGTVHGNSGETGMREGCSLYRIYSEKLDIPALSSSQGLLGLLRSRREGPGKGEALEERNMVASGRDTGEEKRLNRHSGMKKLPGFSNESAPTNDTGIFVSGFLFALELGNSFSMQTLMPESQRCFSFQLPSHSEW